MIHHATKSTAKSASASSCRQALAAMPGTVQEIMARANMPFATAYRACNKMLSDGIVTAKSSETRPTIRSRWPVRYEQTGEVVNDKIVKHETKSQKTANAANMLASAFFNMSRSWGEQ